MKTLTFLLTSLCFILPAEARLGESQAKISERYGKPIQTYRDVNGRTGYIHRSENYLIMVQYVDGVSGSEVYAREDDAKLTEAELKAVLAANASGGKWEEMPASIQGRSSTTRCWAILRTRSMSVYGPSTINEKKFQNAISVCTRAYVAQIKALDNR